MAFLANLYFMIVLIGATAVLCRTTSDHRQLIRAALFGTSQAACTPLAPPRVRPSVRCRRPVERTRSVLRVAA